MPFPYSVARWLEHKDPNSLTTFALLWPASTHSCFTRQHFTSLFVIFLMPKNVIILTLFVLLICSTSPAQQVFLPNPIIFVVQVPIPRDSSTVTATFSNHLADPLFAGRGSDLYIIYPDGTLKNLTQLAGFGTSGFQGANSIAVRQPCIHWSGTKALFSMAIGAPTSQGQQLQYNWQIYEVTNFGEHQTPVITKVPNQPANYNNVSPIYGTDDRIIFTTDRPRGGLKHLYPLLDEHFGFVSNTGLWSLDPISGDLFQLNISPSGAFDPFIDSYGRLLFTRWDHLQRDINADKDAAVHRIIFGTFNYSDESANAVVTSSNTEVFPEPEPIRNDLLAGTNLKGISFNQFFPWQINEDGTSEETLNHVGRHDLLSTFTSSILDDTNVVDFNFGSSGRLNDTTYLQNLLQLTEDPTKPGTYYGVNIFGFDQHQAAQIVSVTAAPSLDPAQMLFTYITDKSTVTSPFEGFPADPNHSGHYRNPLPLSNGKLLVVHTTEPHADRNQGSRANPVSRYSFRIKTMKKAGSVWVADSLVTTGITKTISYWDPDTLVNFSGVMWELDPVEVRVREKPSRRISALPSPEKEVFIEEGVDETGFRNDMKKNDIAMIVSRNVTHRDKSDHQQPYFLKVHGSQTQSANPHGKIYDIAHLQLYQADQIRGMTMRNPSPVPGRRVLPQFMHDSNAVHANPNIASEQAFTTKIASDGSFAAFVPARRAITWALIDTNFESVVRERYWVTAQPGEIRVCASCHGTNDEALVNLDPAPQNKPEALRSILQYWKSSHTPLSTDLISPANDSTHISVNANLLWHSVPNATSYRVMTSATQDFGDVLFKSSPITDTTFTYATNKTNTTFYWRVVAFSSSGDSAYSGIWKFTTEGPSAVSTTPNELLSVSNHPNPFTSVTSIEFILPRSETIKLKIFNVLGEEVASLANGYYSEGIHSLQWDAANIPSGMYYYRLQTSGGVLTKSMRIIR